MAEISTLNTYSIKDPILVIGTRMFSEGSYVMISAK